MKLLLHVCCGPCATYPLIVLSDEGIQVEGLFYNPNIHPLEEYNKRYENAKLLFDTKQLNLHFMDDFRQEEWEKFDKTPMERCTMCYQLRFDRVAKYAKENGFDSFSTSLLVSPYQKHDLIIELCNNAAKKYNIDFYYKDFRPGFREGQSIAKFLGLYRQKYCGCIISYVETKKN